ncbi:MAG: GntR family transcriptional regulator [Alphaproteobacteria bacterium]|nr:GntR family transcriptional regulator [Alphaproteobacteria bacterium]
MAVEPLYQRFERILARSIHAGRLEPGTVLLEGPLAEMFGSSRAPVRQALAALRSANLISRFEGRGHIVGSRRAGIRRVSVSAAMLDVEPQARELRKSFAWEKIYEAVERAIIHRSAFGRFRVNEVELARHHRVSRGVARDVLTRIEGLGMLEKDERQRWTIVPLDRDRLVNLYELREHLEPAALRHALPSLAPAWLCELRHRLASQIAVYPRVSAKALDDLEFDLHVRCLAPGPNRELLAALAKTRCVLTLSKHVLGVEIDVPQSDPFMEEHLRVVEAMVRGDAHGAAALLHEHLQSSRPKVIERLERFRRGFTPAHIPYIG